MAAMRRNLMAHGAWVAVACLVLGAAGCAHLNAGAPAVEARPDLLRVGVTPDAPPIIYKQGGRIEGLEADLTRSLGEELGREVRFIELSWDDQLSALADGKTDIIMSGMSVTHTRQSDVAFTDPYMVGGLMALVRHDEADEFGGPFAFITAAKRVAVQADTTGDYFVRKYMKSADRTAHDTVTEAFQALETGQADLVIHDAPVIWYLAAWSPSSALVPARPRLTVEYYAWAVRPDSGELLDAVNGTLDRWKGNGTLCGLVRKWVPMAE